MSLRRALQSSWNDLRVGLGNQQMGMLLMAPIIIAVSIRLMLPIIDGAKPTIVAAGSFRQLVVDHLERRADVVWVTDRDAVVERVQGVDDIIGVYGDPERSIEVIIEGNELQALRNYPGLVINEAVAMLEGGTPLIVEHEQVALSEGFHRSQSLSLVLFMVVLLMSMFPALAIVGDREANTLDSLRVSPLSFGEYLSAKILVTIDLGAVMTFTVALILFGLDVSWTLLAVGFMACLPSAWLVLTVVGAFARDQMTAMGLVRVVAIVMMLPIGLSLYFGESGSLWLAPWTMHWAGQALFAALEGQVSLAAEAFLWSVVTGIPLVALAAWSLKRRLKWS